MYHDRFVQAIEELEVLFEPDDCQGGIERIEFRDLGLLAVFVVFCIFSG